jgi:hypothetical protein
MAFASVDDIAVRLEAAPLSNTSEAAAEMLLKLATAIIAQAVDKDDEWAAALTPVPTILRALTVELVCRAMASPQGLASASETLGAYQRSETYRRDLSSALLLTDMEEKLARRTVLGQRSGTAQMKSLASDLCVLCGLAPTICGGEWFGGEWLCGCEGS